MVHGGRAQLVVGLIISQTLGLSVSVCISCLGLLQSVLRTVLAGMSSSQRRFGLDQLRIGLAAAELLLPGLLGVEVVADLRCHSYDLFWFT